jgi:uncharacterized membrane protein
MSTSIVSRRSKTSRTLVLLTAIMMNTTMVAPAYAGKRTKGYPKVSKTMAQACAAGALTGALAGAAISKKKNRTESILIGAGAGLLAGCVAGKALDNRRQKYATQAEFLDNEIITARQVNEETQQVNAHLTGIIDSNKQKIVALQQKKASATLDKKEAKKAYKQAKADHKWANKQLESVNNDIEYNEASLNSVKESGVAPEKVAQYAEETAKLKARKEELVKQVNYLVEQRDAIGQMVST